MTANMGLPAATTTAHCQAVLDQIGRAVVGKRGALTLILTTVLAGGHVLIEDLPGLGKTLIARSFAAAAARPTMEMSSGAWAVASGDGWKAYPES